MPEIHNRKLSIDSSVVARMRTLCHARGADLATGLAAVSRAVVTYVTGHCFSAVGWHHHVETSQACEAFEQAYYLHLSSPILPDITFAELLRITVIDRDTLTFNTAPRCASLALDLSARVPATPVGLLIEIAVPTAEPEHCSHPSTGRSWGTCLDRLEAPAALSVALQYRGGLDACLFYSDLWFDEYSSNIFATYWSLAVDRFSMSPNQSVFHVLSGETAALSPVELGSNVEALLKIRQPMFPGTDAISHIIDGFQSSVRTNATKVAIRAKGFDLTYAELKLQADTLAHSLLLYRAQPGSTIALLLPHDYQMIVGILGALTLGFTYVPIDPGYPDDYVHRIVTEASPAIVVTSAANRARLLSFGFGASYVHVVDDDHAEHPSLPVGLMIQRATNTYACILFTSGSTGRPKGTCHSHESLLEAIRNYSTLTRLSNSDRCVVTASYCHIMATVDIFSALLSGATLILFNVRREGAAALPKLIDQHQVTVLRCPASVFRSVFRELAAGFTLPSLRAVALGADPVMTGDAALFQARCSKDSVLFSTYGSTEVTSCAASILGAASRSSPNLSGELGWPIGRYSFALVDPYGYPTPLYGEIRVMGPYGPAPYLENERPVSTNVAKPHRTYNSGDLARRRSPGLLTFEGRFDEQIKLRGFHVDLREIDRSLGSLQGIGQAASVAVRNEVSVPDIVSFVVSSHGSTITSIDIITLLRSRMPSHMVPALVEIVDSIPVTLNGKIDRSSLRRAAQVALDHARALEEALDPQTTISVERFVTLLWMSILCAPSLREDDNFFSLGGDSLSAVRMLSHLHDQFAVHIRMDDFFDNPTVANVVRRLKSNEPAATT